MAFLLYIKYVWPTTWAGLCAFARFSAHGQQAPCSRFTSADSFFTGQRPVSAAYLSPEGEAYGFLLRYYTTAQSPKNRVQRTEF